MLDVSLTRLRLPGQLSNTAPSQSTRHSVPVRLTVLDAPMPTPNPDCMCCGCARCSCMTSGRRRLTAWQHLVHCHCSRWVAGWVGRVLHVSLGQRESVWLHNHHHHSCHTRYVPVCRDNDLSNRTQVCLSCINHVPPSPFTVSRCWISVHHPPTAAAPPAPLPAYTCSCCSWPWPLAALRQLCSLQGGPCCCRCLWHTHVTPATM
jgi:hypothetical protein